MSFATYHPHYNDKTIGNPIQTFVYIVNRFYFLNYWSNLSADSFLTHDINIYTTKPDLLLENENRQKSFHFL